MPPSLVSRGLVGKHEEGGNQLSGLAHSLPGTARHVTTFTVTPLAVLTNEKLQEFSHETEHEEYKSKPSQTGKRSQLSSQRTHASQGNKLKGGFKSSKSKGTQYGTFGQPIKQDGPK